MQKKLAYSKEIILDYWEHSRRYPWLLVLFFGAATAVQVAVVIAPIYLRDFLNVLATSTPSAEAVQVLSTALVFFAVATFAAWGFRRIQQVTLVHLETRVMADLDMKAFSYLIGHSYQFFVNNFAGSLVRRVNRYNRSYEVIADALMMQIYPALLFALGIIGVLTYYSRWLGLALAGWTILFLAIQFLMIRALHPIRLARAAEDSAVTGVIADAVSNQSTIALFAGSLFERSRLLEAVSRLRALTVRTWLRDDLVWAVQGFLMAVINIALLWGAMYYWQHGMLTVGDFILIQSYLIVLFERLVNIGREMRHVYSAFADAAEMMEILQTPHAVADAPHAKPLSIDRGEVRFDTVQFYFDSTRPILNQFNLVVHGGEKVALVGPSGAGKSTVTKLLLRLYDIQRGAIEIDHQNIADVQLDSLRKAIAFVPQEPVLFHRSLMENIRYGRRDASDSDVIDASRRAHCHEFIKKLPHGYETLVGERGIKLSGGERQRIAIARAILKDAPILILDEATSSLDSESEALIQDALRALMEGKTVIVIAHRLSTIMKMDRILVIENGAVTAEGTHADLLTQGGRYQKLWEIQAGGFTEQEPEKEEIEPDLTSSSKEVI